MKNIIFFEELIWDRFLSNFEPIWEAQIQPQPSPNEDFFEEKNEEVSKRDIRANLKKNREIEGSILEALGPAGGVGGVQPNNNIPII